MLINCQCHSAKVAQNTNRLNFASNNLEYQTNGIHTNFACNKMQNMKPLYAFQKLARYIELENF